MFFVPSTFASEHPLREWKLLDGTIIFARYASTDQTKIILERVDASEQICRFGELSELDQKYLTAMRYIDGDREQFNQGSRLLSQLIAGDRDSIDRFESLANKQKDAPYASLWLGVALATIANETNDSRAAFEEAIRICEQQRSSDPIRHRRTLMAAFNNKAIALIREREEERAAVYFLKAFEIAEGAPLSLVHNTRQFLEITSARNFPRKPSESDRKKLTSLVDASSFSNTQNLPIGYHYSLDAEVPSGVTHAYGFDEVAPPHPSLELHGVTLGVVVGRNTVLTADYALSKTEGKNVSVTAYRGNDVAKKQIPASEILVHAAHPLLLANEASKTYPAASINNWSPVRVNARPSFSSPIPDDLISIVRFEELDAAPARYVRSHAVEKEEFVALGFKRARSFLAEGPIFSKQMQSKPTEHASFYGSSIPISFCTRGAPVLDPTTGLVRGFLVRESSEGASSESRGEYVSSSAIADWLRLAAPGCDFLESETSGDSVRENLDVVKQATLPLLIWKQKDTPLDPLLREFFGERESNSVASNTIPLAIRDPWCFHCKGVSVITCRVCEGRGARVVGVENKIHSINPITKQPRILPVQQFAPCETCKTTGKADCPFCESGKTLTKSP